jgi:hypothetical protein
MKTISRRLIRLEARAAVVIAELASEPHILCFIDTDMRVVSEFNMGTGAWTHFEDTPAFESQPKIASDIHT